MESDRYYEMRDVQEGTKKDSPQHVQATKWLAERYGHSTHLHPKRGRPSKDEIESERKRLATENDDLNDDAQRIGIL